MNKRTELVNLLALKRARIEMLTDMIAELNEDTADLDYQIGAIDRVAEAEHSAAIADEFDSPDDSDFDDGSFRDEAIRDEDPNDMNR